MSGDRRRRVEDLYLRVLDLSPEERTRILEEECGGDRDLREEVLSLVAHFERAGSEFLDSPPVAPEFLDALDPREIGPYRILQRLGEGGFGLVYVAEQSTPVRRRVALKVLKAGMDTRAVLARFEAERQALALMDHPNIARVLDGGATDNGRPYFVMELVKGDPLTEYCNRHRLSVRERVELFIPVCQAVQHAHQRGIIHRDLKPSNILVSVVDGVPVPKVIDFGIAKATATPLTDKTVHTMHGQLMGTPTYMSPEQAERTGLDVDTTTDVYSLGVLLHELVTGHLPFSAEELLADGLEGLSRRLRQLEVPLPSQRAAVMNESTHRLAEERSTDPDSLPRQIRGDLDWILLRTLEKDRTRRYQTASMLAQELQRHLDDEPVEAGPPDARYRLRKFARRNRVALGVVAAILFGVVGAAGGLAIALIETNRQKAEIETAFRSAESARRESEAVTEFLAGVLGAANPESFGRDATVLEVLDRASADLERTFADRPLLLARLRVTVGATFRELGDYERAEANLRRGYETRLDLLGPEEEPTMEALREIGELHHHLGEYAVAESVFSAVREARLRRHGPAHRLTLQVENDLAGIFVRSERGDPAIRMLEAALDRGGASLEPRDALRIELLSNLASAYETEERNDEAERLLAEVLRLERELHGADHPRVATTCQILGGLHRKLGRFARAEPLYEESSRISRAAFGPDHLTTLRFDGNRALLYSDMGRYPEALELNRSVLESKRRVLGSEHPSTLASFVNLCLLRLRTGDFVECERDSRECLELCEQHLGASHSYSLISRGVLGMAVLGQSRPVEAEGLLRQALAGWLEVADPDHWRVGFTRSQLGQVLVELDRMEEAESELLEGYRALEAAFGPGHDRTREVSGHLAALYDRWGRPGEAARWRETAEPNP